MCDIIKLLTDRMMKEINDKCWAEFLKVINR
jgi:hypothetical protein